MDVEWIFTPLDAGRTRVRSCTGSLSRFPSRRGFSATRRQRLLHPRRRGENAGAHETLAEAGGVKHRVAVTGRAPSRRSGSASKRSGRTCWPNTSPFARSRAFRPTATRRASPPRSPTSMRRRSWAASVCAGPIASHNSRWPRRAWRSTTRLSRAGDGTDTGVFIGSALGGLAYADEQHDVFRERARPRCGRCSRSRSSAARRRATSRWSSAFADPTWQRQLVRVGRGRDRRCVPGDRAGRRARRARRRLRSAALAAGLRRVHRHSRDVDAQRRSGRRVPPVRPRPRRLRDGRGRGDAGARALRRRAARAARASTARSPATA